MTWGDLCFLSMNIGRWMAAPSPVSSPSSHGSPLFLRLLPVGLRLLMLSGCWDLSVPDFIVFIPSLDSRLVFFPWVLCTFPPSAILDTYHVSENSAPPQRQGCWGWGSPEVVSGLGTRGGISPRLVV